MPARKIEIISGIDLLGSNNILDCLECQEVVITAQNVHNTSLTLQDIQLNFIGALPPDISYSILEVNGGTPSYPYTIGVGDTFTFKLQACFAIAGGTSNFSVDLVFYTAEHLDEDPYPISFTKVLICDIFSDTLVDFGTVPGSSTQTQNIFITNDTIAAFTIDIVSNTCPGSISITPSSSLIPVGATIPFAIEWNAGAYPDTVACSVILGFSSLSCGCEITISGVTEDLDCDAGTSICCLDITINTENDYLDAYDELCFPDMLYRFAAILEKKQIIYYLKYFEAFTNNTIVYFNASLFDDSGTDFQSYALTDIQPPQYYTLTYNTSLINGTPYAMNLANTGSNNNNQRNIQAYITFLDPANGRFKITFDFFVLCDKESIIDSFTFGNKNKYQKSTISSTTAYTNTLPSVYLQNEYLGAYVVVQKASNRVSLLHNLPFTARFYNSGLYGGISEFSNPTFTLTRNIGTVTTFSSIEQTKVSFTINVPAIYSGAAHILFHLIDETLNDNTLQFLAATDSSRSEITNIPTAGVLNNHLLSPATITYLGSNVYEATCYVDTNLDSTHQYRLFAIVYSGSKKVVNTFKSPLAYRISTIPEYDCTCLPEITSYWSNYFESREADDYRPVGKERIKHRLVIAEGDVSDCLTSWGLSFPDWRKALTGIKLRIYKRYLGFPSDPNINYTTFFEYGNYQSVRNNSYGTGWQDLTSMEVIDMNTEIWVSINDVRVRWENTYFNGNVSQCNNDTYMTKYPVTGVTASNYIASLNILNTWIDEEVFFEYELIFDLSSYFTQPFKFSLCKAYRVNAISFENVNSGFPDHILSQTVEGLDTSTNTWIPVSSPINYGNFSQIRITYLADDYGWFNFFIEKSPFGISNLIESNPITSPQGLSFNFPPSIVDSESTEYLGSPIEAQVVLNTQFFENTSYLFCGYWSEKSEFVPCWYFDIHYRISGTLARMNMITPTYDNDIIINFTAAVTGSYLCIRSGSAIYGSPVIGNTYTFHYSFNTATTRVLDIWFSQTGFVGTPDITLPIGSTNGIITFVWPSVTAMIDYWTIKCDSGTNYSGQGIFRIGNESCDE